MGEWVGESVGSDVWERCRDLIPAGSVFAFLAEHRGELFPAEVFVDMYAFTESGGLIHYKYGLVLAVPSANQPGWSADMWISFASAWADAKIKVNWHDGASWSAAVDLDVTGGGGGRVHNGAKLPANTQKIAIGRVRKSANDTQDDIPVSWLLQVAEA